MRPRKQQRSQRRINKERAKFPYVVQVIHNCICCTATMHFKDARSARTAFITAGLTDHARIIDDAGVVHEDVCTTHGFISTGYVNE